MRDRLLSVTTEMHQAVEEMRRAVEKERLKKIEKSQKRKISRLKTERKKLRAIIKKMLHDEERARQVRNAHLGKCQACGASTIQL